ncbi:hypothetical protein BDA96_04G111400 [Sorghum bicolor]|uniref:Uncharacterized protein n=1 Tax=Sorghum bicolor TaxID=4558 RepID=A0A921R3L8_SORBI|nr:hypothetical protein BDA96_04G111400 [Sorghum bicolor]
MFTKIAPSRRLWWIHEDQDRTHQCSGMDVIVRMHVWSNILRENIRSRSRSILFRFPRVLRISHCPGRLKDDERLLQRIHIRFRTSEGSHAPSFLQ